MTFVNIQNKVRLRNAKRQRALEKLAEVISTNYRELFVLSMQLQNPGNFGDCFRVGESAVPRRDDQFRFREVQMRTRIGDNSIGTL